MRTEDGYIIHQCLYGEPASFGLLVDKYKAGVYALVYAELGDFHDAQDVTQETFLRAYKKLPSLRRWDSFAAWLHSIARNLCKDWQSNQYRRVDTQKLGTTGVGVSSVNAYEVSQNHQSLHDAIEALPAIYRQVLSLHYFGGLSGEQMAEILGISPNAVHQRLSRARRELRGELIEGMNSVADTVRLQPGFTFHIVEMVKRIKHPISPNIIPLPVGISVIVGLWFALTMLSGSVLPLTLMGRWIGSTFPTSSQSVEDGDIPATSSAEMHVTILSGNLGEGNFGSEIQATEQAPTPGTNWDRRLGRTGNEVAGEVQQTRDGGYIVVGRTDSPTLSHGGSDVYLAKVDRYGVVGWERHFGGPAYDEGSSVQQTRDGGYIFSGGSCSFSGGGFDVYVVKVDQHGNLEWELNHGGPEDDYGYSVQQAQDGGYVVAGTTRNRDTDGGMYNVYLIKVGTHGAVEWERQYGGQLHDTARCVAVAPDGGYVVVGNTISYGVGGRDVYLMKVDASGNVEWEQNYGGTNADTGNCVQQTQDGGYILTGSTLSFGNGDDASLYLVKIGMKDSLPFLHWEMHYHPADGADSVGYAVRQTRDGGYIVAGCTGPTDNSDLYLLKVDEQGIEQWTRCLSGSGKSVGRSVCQAADGGYVVASDTKSSSDGGSDIHLVNIAPF